MVTGCEREKGPNEEDGRTILHVKASRSFTYYLPPPTSWNVSPQACNVICSVVTQLTQSPAKTFESIPNRHLLTSTGQQSLTTLIPRFKPHVNVTNCPISEVQKCLPNVSMCIRLASGYLPSLRFLSCLYVNDARSPHQRYSRLAHRHVTLFCQRPATRKVQFLSSCKRYEVSLSATFVYSW